MASKYINEYYPYGVADAQNVYDYFDIDKSQIRSISKKEDYDENLELREELSRFKILNELQTKRIEELKLDLENKKDECQEY